MSGSAGDAGLKQVSPWVGWLTPSADDMVEPEAKFVVGQHL